MSLSDTDIQTMRASLRGRTRRCTKGAILVDVVIGMFMMALATVTFMSLFPVIKKGGVMATQEAKAAHIANRMLEHVQMLSPRDLTPEALNSLNLVDDGEDASPYSFTNVPLDEASRYSPAQALRDGEGTMTITDLGSGSKLVELEVTYTSAGGNERVIKTGTILGGYR